MLPAIRAPIDLSGALREAPCGSFEPEVNITQIEEAQTLFDWEELGLSQAQRLVVIAFLKTANVGQACGLVGVPPTQHKRWLKESTGYQTAFTAAFDVVVDRVEGKAFELAMNGNTDMIKMLLKGRRRDVYGEKVEHSGTVQHTLSWADIARQAAHTTIDVTPVETSEEADRPEGVSEESSGHSSADRASSGQTLPSEEPQEPGPPHARRDDGGSSEIPYPSFRADYLVEEMEL